MRNTPIIAEQTPFNFEDKPDGILYFFRSTRSAIDLMFKEQLDTLPRNDAEGAYAAPILRCAPFRLMKINRMIFPFPNFEWYGMLVFQGNHLLWVPTLYDGSLSTYITDLCDDKKWRRRYRESVSVETIRMIFNDYDKKAGKELAAHMVSRTAAGLSGISGDELQYLLSHGLVERSITGAKLACCTVDCPVLYYGNRIRRQIKAKMEKVDVGYYSCGIESEFFYTEKQFEHSYVSNHYQHALVTSLSSFTSNKKTAAVSLLAHNEAPVETTVNTTVSSEPAKVS